VLFVHGDCGGNPFAQWVSLPAQLARCGYVVAVSSFGGVPATGDPAVTTPLRQLHDWMRSTWEYRDRLMRPPHATAEYRRGWPFARWRTRCPARDRNPGHGVRRPECRVGRLSESACSAVLDHCPVVTP